MSNLNKCERVTVLRAGLARNFYWGWHLAELAVKTISALRKSVLSQITIGHTRGVALSPHLAYRARFVLQETLGLFRKAACRSFKKKSGT